MATALKSIIGDGTAVLAGNWFTVIPAVGAGLTLALHGLLVANATGNGGQQANVTIRLTKSNGDVAYLPRYGPVQVGGLTEVMEATHTLEEGDTLEAQADVDNALTLIASYAERS